MATRNQFGTVLSISAIVMASVSLTATSANAALVVEEPFDYTAGNINTQNGGTGFDGAWNSTKSHGQDYQTGLTTYNSGDGTTLNDDSGLFFSTLNVAGSALSRFGSAGRAQANRTISAASQAALLGDNTTMWFSALFGSADNFQKASLLFGTEVYSTDIPQVLSIAGDGFGFTAVDVDGASDGNGAINALAFDGSVTPTVVASTFTQTIQPGGTHYDTSLIVGKINWKANGTPDELFLFNVTDLSTEPAEGTAIASITNLDFDQSLFDTVATWDSNTAITDEIRFGNTFADVTPLQPPPPLLTLEVNTLTGALTMLGDPNNAIDINFYEITSAGNSLDANGWNSLADQDFEGSGPPNGSGDGWEESGGVGAHVLAEGWLLGDSSIAAAASISLGSGYDEGVDAQDLMFEYRTDTREYVEGLVVYGAGIPGDFDGNGVVDGSDFLLWQRDQSVGSLADWQTNYGTTPIQPGDFDGNGEVNGLDFLEWQRNPSIGLLTDWEMNYGQPFAPLSAATAAVPEPTTSALALAAFCLAMGRRRSH